MTPLHFSVIMYKHLRKVKHSSLAQSVEHSAVNRVVVGSSPTRGAIKTTQKCVVFSFVYEFCVYQTTVGANWVRLFYCNLVVGKFGRTQFAPTKKCVGFSIKSLLPREIPPLGGGISSRGRLHNRRGN